MSKSKSPRPYDFGRVFFPDKDLQNPNKQNSVPTRILFQPLGNHVSNVRYLVNKWNLNDFPGKTLQEHEESRKRVSESARLHDIAKPQKFSIKVETTPKKDPKGKFKEYIYSFSGHRFLASSPSLWVQNLAIGHHDFSVGDICRDTYKLKNLKYDSQSTDVNAETYAEILEKDPLAYARELYILEMCDQIEAELACLVIGDKKQAEARTFMDYTVKVIQDEQNPFIYEIDPWPFRDNLDSIELSFAYWTMQISEQDQAEIEKYVNDNQCPVLENKLRTWVKDWWKSQQANLKVEILKATIKPLLKPNSRTIDFSSLYQTLPKVGFSPNPMQANVGKIITENANLAILLKAPTGSGKTEAVLFPALANGYRLFLPLPARSLIEDQKERIGKYLEEFSKKQPDREFSLVVDTGAQMSRLVYKNGEEISNIRRHLYKGDVILTTLDKFLYRYFAFGDKQKSFTFPLRIHREKTIICIDEAHSYDEISFTNFQSLVQSLYEAGRSLVLMTATMPQEHVERFDYLDVIDYIDDSNNAEALRQFQQKSLKQLYPDQRGFEWFSNIERHQDNPESFQDEFFKIVLKEWQAKANRRIIAVVETVTDAVAIYQKLKDQLGSNTDTQGQFLFLYHGRIANQLRPELYKKLKKRDEENQPYILITTSAIEVGCDLNSEVLISQIFPPENLIQRAGRCNRKGNISDAKVCLVGNSIPEFANTLDESGWKTYQKTLRSLQHFDTKAISGCISRSKHVDDYRIVELFSMLYEYVYGADLTCQPAHEKGLVITRSWTPSATLVYDDGTQNIHQVTVPIDRLIKKEGNQYANIYVCENYYDQEETRRKTRPLSWGSAYQKDIVIKIGSPCDGAFMYEEGKDYEYDPELGFVDLPGVFIRLKATGFEEKLLCQHEKNDRKKSAIITYAKKLDTKTY